jgi:small subunit ribosomal protein S20
MAAKAPVKKSISGIKRARQNDVRRLRNTSILSNIKTQEKKVLKAVENELVSLKDVYIDFVTALDKAVKIGIIHENKAIRKKSRFNKRIEAGKSSTAKTQVKPKAPKGESAKDKSIAKAKTRSRSKK